MRVPLVTRVQLVTRVPLVMRVLLVTRVPLVTRASWQIVSSHNEWAGYYAQIRAHGTWQPELMGKHQGITRGVDISAACSLASSALAGASACGSCPSTCER